MIRFLSKEGLRCYSWTRHMSHVVNRRKTGIQLELLSRVRKILGSILLIAMVLALSGCTGGGLISQGSGWAAALATEDTVYVGTIGGDVLALVGKDGNVYKDTGVEIQWKFPANEIDRTDGLYGTPAIHNGLIFLGGNNGKLYALDQDPEKDIEDRQVWSSKVSEGRIVGGPVVIDNVFVEGNASPVDMVIVGSGDGKLHAFYTKNGNHVKLPGETVWTFPAEGKVGEIWSSPEIHDDKVIFGSLDHYVYAVSLKDGTELWKYKTGGAVVGKPLIVENNVIIGSFDRTLYALSLSKGEEQWRFSADDWFWSGPQYDGTKIYAATMGGTVYALSKRGQERWSFQANGPIVSRPLVLNDNLVVATEQGRIYRLSVRGGIEEWFYDIDSEVRAPLIGRDDVVFVSSMDQMVRAVNVQKGLEIWKVNTKR